MSHFWTLCYSEVILLMVVPTECTAVTETPYEEIYGLQGQDALLPCYTEQHDLAPLTFTLYKLPKGNEMEELLYPTSNLTAEQQRWSLQRRSGTVIFVLHKGRFSDNGWYKCEVHRGQNCLNVSRMLLKIRECEILEKVEAVQNSVAIFTCPVPTPQTGPTHVIWEVVEGDKSISVQHCPSSCTVANKDRTNIIPQCERVRTVQDPATGTESLIIRPVEKIDASWYRCKVEAMQYCAEVRITVKEEKPFQLRAEDCQHVGSFSVMVNSTVTFSCPVLTLHPEAKEVIWRTIEGDQSSPTNHCPSLCTSSSDQKPLCERSTVLKNGSLTIGSVEFADAQWYGCAVNANACSRFRLIVTEKHFESGGDIISVFNKDSRREGPVDGNSNVTVMVTVSTVFGFILIALLVAVGFCLRKRKSKVESKIELENQYTSYEEILVNDNTMYSLVEFNTAEMCTFKDQCTGPQGYLDVPVISNKCEYVYGI
ncbi:uncharacterized protein LOC143519503 isoform X2 [Brachyhypopomus gauderio]|uniref:uncharacterized protein LOC143519503 isoform X2 n=1 Tax=Brachyhypopomus gauderio TaxID=698409 RepID=UPI0040418EAF